MQSTSNDVNNLHFIASNQCTNHLNNHLNSHLNSHLNNHLSNHLNNANLSSNLTNNLNNNSASYNCIVTNKTPSVHQLIPHHSATNLTTATSSSSSNSTQLCFSCKNHAHQTSVNTSVNTSATKLSNSNTSLTNAANSSSTNIYNRNKLEQSLIEAKLRVAQLKKELNHLQSSKQLNSNQYLSSLNSLNNYATTGTEDQVDFAVCSNGTTSRESQIRMLNNYMQEAVESVYGSQSNSRHSSQQQLALPAVRQGLSSSSISTDSLRTSLRNSTSSVHLTHQLSNHPHFNNLHVNNHPPCNHQSSTSDSCASENIYSNQQIINNLNKSRSANTINFKSSNSLSKNDVSNSNLNNHNTNHNLNHNLNHNANHNLNHNNANHDPNSSNNLAADQSELNKARQRVNRLKSDLEANSENYVIYSNQSVILAQQKQKQLDLDQKINDQPAQQSPSIDESFNLLSIIDKYYRKNDNSTAVEV